MREPLPTVALDGSVSDRLSHAQEVLFEWDRAPRSTRPSDQRAAAPTCNTCRTRGNKCIATGILLRPLSNESAARAHLGLHAGAPLVVPARRSSSAARCARPGRVSRPRSARQQWGARGGDVVIVGIVVGMAAGGEQGAQDHGLNPAHHLRHGTGFDQGCANTSVATFALC